MKILLPLFLFLTSCDSPKNVNGNTGNKKEAPIVLVEEKRIEVGASDFDTYLPMIKDKNIAVLVNQTSTIAEAHLVDVLLSKGISIKTIFAPEHGFRGEADAGEKVIDGKDAKTDIPIVSLYGKKKKPGAEDLKGIDVVLFDIQDVGVRFYTYISTMTYMMEACQEFGIQLIVLDRPNPNGHYVDGPVLKEGFESFIGMHQIPVVHGMTVGEYAKMVNGEGWLKNGEQCKLEVVKCKNYNHNSSYSLPIKPSPNLPNDRSIYLYPSLCFFEGTTANVGRGTNKQFQTYGHPKYQGGDTQYTPKSMPGAKHPKFKNTQCNGFDLTNLDPNEIRSKAQLDLNYLINFYKTFPEGELFFLKNNFFDKLAGTNELRRQILEGKDAATIRASWQKDLKAFKKVRSEYLLYY